jgi:hypothetical protein
MPQVQGAAGEAIAGYCQPSATQEMVYHRLSRRVNNMAVFGLLLDFTVCAVANDALQRYNILEVAFIILYFSMGCHVVYATLG